MGKILFPIYKSKKNGKIENIYFYKSKKTKHEVRSEYDIQMYLVFQKNWKTPLLYKEIWKKSKKEIPKNRIIPFLDRDCSQRFFIFFFITFEERRISRCWSSAQSAQVQQSCHNNPLKIGNYKWLQYINYSHPKTVFHIPRTLSIISNFHFFKKPIKRGKFSKKIEKNQIVYHHSYLFKTTSRGLYSRIFTSAG